METTCSWKLHDIGPTKYQKKFCQKEIISISPKVQESKSLNTLWWLWKCKNFNSNGRLKWIWPTCIRVYCTFLVAETVILNSDDNATLNLRGDLNRPTQRRPAFGFSDYNIRLPYYFVILLVFTWRSTGGSPWKITATLIIIHWTADQSGQGKFAPLTVAASES